MKVFRGGEKVWVQFTGRIQSGHSIDSEIAKHQDALVAAGFLRQEEFAMPTDQAREPDVEEALRCLHAACPWDAARRHSTTLVVIACAEGMERWRERARGLGMVTQGRAKEGWR